MPGERPCPAQGPTTPASQDSPGHTRRAGHHYDTPSTTRGHSPAWSIFHVVPSPGSATLRALTPVGLVETPPRCGARVLCSLRSLRGSGRCGPQFHLDVVGFGVVGSLEHLGSETPLCLGWQPGQSCSIPQSFCQPPVRPSLGLWGPAQVGCAATRAGSPGHRHLLF